MDALWLLGGPLLAGVVFLSTAGAELGTEGRIVLALTAWMALWWITEAVPIAVTALLPLPVLALTGTQGFGTTSLSYGHRIIFLALSGFVLAAAVERWGIHRRVARTVLAVFGGSAGRLVAGFMIVSALLSMWISNTATCILMLPIALSVLGRDSHPNLAPSLLLGTAYACSIGGMTTLVGTTTNMFFAGYAEDSLGTPVAFLQWTAFSAPVAVVLGLVIWAVLTRVLFPVDRVPDLPEVAEREPWTAGARGTAVVFALTALGWVFAPWLAELPGLGALSMYEVGLVALVALFVLPAGKGERLMDWKTAQEKVPWGVLILIGGGLALAKAFTTFGVSAFLASTLQGAAGLPGWALILLMVALMVLLTEVTSNVASLTALTPVLASVALAVGLPPILAVSAIALAASCAFMLPVATPPNAVVYGSGRLHMRQMVRAGVVLNAIAIPVVALWAYAVGPLMF